MAPASTKSLYFLQCILGLEPLLLSEIQDNGYTGRAQEGGVEVRGGAEVLYFATHQSRLTESARIRLKEFKAHDFHALRAGIKKLPWRAYLAPGAKIQVQAVCHGSRLYHSGAVEERVGQILVEHASLTVVGEGEAPTLHIRVVDDVVHPSLEAAAHLHRRGYRRRVEKASLRETLAAALVRVAFQQGQPRSETPFLWDPFCGAGTLVLEALHMSSRRLIERQEQPYFVGFRNQDAVGYEAWLRSSRVQGESVPEGLHVLGSDRSSKAIDASGGNASDAHFENAEFVVGEIEQVAERVPRGALIATNPPYGKRLEDVEGVRKLLRVLEVRPDLRPCVALVGGAGRDIIPKSAAALFRTKNGGISVSARSLSSGGVPARPASPRFPK